jgi:hypothetical protein
MTTRKLLEDIRGLYEAKMVLSNAEEKKVLQAFERGLGVKKGTADSNFGDGHLTGSSDFAHSTDFEMYVGAPDSALVTDTSAKYHVTIENPHASSQPVIASENANSIPELLKLVQQLAKKHKKKLVA